MPRAVLALVALSAMLAARDAAAQARPEPPPPRVITATAIVRGRIMERNGSPVRAADVRLRAVEGGSDIRVATADQNGQYEIRDLPPGKWSLKASKAGFVTQSSTQATPLDEDKPLVLADGQRLVADVVLTRAGAIAGRVVDEHGEPLGNAGVRALRLRTVAGRPQLFPFGAPDATDDTGAFRIYGIPPGTYYVVTARRSGATSPLLLDEPGIYFPGTTDLQSAQTIALRAGEEQLGITIAVPPPERSVTVSGRVFSATGTIALRTMLHLIPNGPSLGPNSLGRTVPALPDGAFSVSSVPPGSYTIDASADSAPSGVIEQGRLSVEVGAQDVTDLVVTMTRARTLQGTVVAESGVVLPKPFPFKITLERPDVSFSSLRMDTRPTGEFTVDGVSGVNTLRVSVPDGWMVKSMEMGGSDLGHGAVDFSALPLSSTIRVVVTNRVGELTGTVTTRSRTADGSVRAAVVVFPEDETMWGDASRFVVMSRAETNGRFRVSGLLAEPRYRVVAVSYLEPDEYRDPAFLKRMRESSVAFGLRDGEKKSLDLTLIER